jgi:hypothetical protein
MMPITKVGDLGNDTLVGVGGELNYLFGDTDTTLEGATGGNDTLTGGANGENYIYGDALNITGGAAAGGDDTLTGGRNSINHLYGDAGTMGAPSTGGNDTLIGGVGGVNYLYGDAANANGPPHGGDDRLVSAANTTDHMWGDFESLTSPAVEFGNDTYVFGPNNGTDFIYDFHKGEDIIEIDASAIPTQAPIPANAAQHAARNFPDTFEELDIQELDANGDSTTDSVIQLGGSNTVTVLGVTGLTDTDFNFVI